jgi:hypothetical protein
MLYKSMDLSFVIYYHSSRLANLKQMIRFLSRREDVGRTELVLVCQNSCDWVPSGFGAARSLSLGLPTYKKPVLCNRGVEASTGRITALLDSDRILPHGWFGRAAAEVRPGQVLTTLNLAWCARPYTDEEIEEGRIELIPDPKSPENDPLRKNAFSGNTVMHRKDYLRVKMDERFVSYGFADNDMVESCRSKGLSFVYRDEPELHLHHEKYVIVDGREVPRSDFRLHTLLNGLKFSRKWKKALTPALLNLLKTVRSEHKGSPLMAEIEALAKTFRTF